MDTHKIKIHAIGQAAEQQAYDFLTSKGLTLLQKNYRCLLGEIDLIMRDGEDVVFIEVRSRNRADYGDAIESIDMYKQKKIIKTATYYLQKQNWYDKVFCRFDVVGICHAEQDSTLEWIKDAFTDIT